MHCICKGELSFVEDICTVMYRKKSTKEIACTVYVQELRISNAEITCTVHVQEEFLLSRIRVKQVKPVYMSE